MTLVSQSLFLVFKENYCYETFTLHNIPPSTPPFFVSDGWRVQTFRKAKIWTEPSFLKSHWNSLSRSKNNTRQDHKSSVDKFLRVLFYIYIYTYFPNRINLSSEDNSKCLKKISSLLFLFFKEQKHVSNLRAGGAYLFFSFLNCMLMN